MIYKCKICGGSLEIKENETIAVCEYCGTKQTLPKLDSEKKSSLLDRANHFRRNNEYDKAMSIYETILADEKTDAEVYWLIVLCRYGIEYVEDPSTHKRIPTVNRVQYASILNDEDYLKAIELADSNQKDLYIEEANKINDIQTGILEVSNKEEPFDIFICYKETDDNGRRTEDSVIAQDIYKELTNEGYKVFFSRITLEDKIGTAYEPYIFAALNSAKVMLSIGTKIEYFNAVWVRNEWSRYLALIKKGEKKTLVPCYKNMDPYDLPEEFAYLQAQDLNKLGYMQDLIRGINKIIKKPRENRNKYIELTNNNSNVHGLVKRMYSFVEESDFEKANEYTEKILDIDIENVDAYIVKLMLKYKVNNRKQLADVDYSFENDKDYRKIIDYGDSNLILEMKEYINTIKERNINGQYIDKYKNATIMMNEAKTEKEYNDAARAFEEIQGFRDADTLRKACIKKAEDYYKETIYNEALFKMSRNRIDLCYDALEALNKIQDYRNTNELIEICEKKIEELEIEKQKLNRDKENSTKKKKSIMIIVGIVVICITIYILFSTKIAKREKDYNNAISLLEEGNIIDTYEKLIMLDGYKDSKEIANEIYGQYINLKFKSLYIGDSLFYGTYEQDDNVSNGKERIEWEIIDKEENKLLLISKYGLDIKKCHNNSKYVKWNDCDLHNWLNSEFYNDAFTDEEKELIEISQDDKVTLLNVYQAEEYFANNNKRQCAPTVYLQSQSKYFQDKFWNDAQYGRVSDNDYCDIYYEKCSWWVLYPNTVGNVPTTIVAEDGSIAYDVDTFSMNAVRPAIWIGIKP